MTILFHEIVYGPVHSRRLGTSLGVNLLPYDGKLCSFDCIYCECGFNKDFRTHTKLPDRENVRAAIEDKMQKLQKEGIEPDDKLYISKEEKQMLLEKGYMTHEEDSYLQAALAQFK